MKPVLIIKTGETVESLPEETGDFEDWIMSGMQLSSDNFQVVNVFAAEVLPPHETVRGIVITGSPAMVTDKQAWSEDTARYLKIAIAENLPVLGICYGHQLLAHALGGRVNFHPRGREIGTAKVKLSTFAKYDPLFKGFNTEFSAHVSHGQTVAELPADAVILASNDFEPHHCVRYGEKAWGVQFHPEFNADIMRAYLNDRKGILLEEGFDLDDLHRTIEETPEAEKLLNNFSKIL